MAKYHIHPETEAVSSCKAKKKCPFGAVNEHFDNKKDAQTYIEERAKLEATIDSRKQDKILHPGTVIAFKSPLTYHGEEPAWLHNHNNKYLEKDGFPVPPRIIDLLEYEDKKAAVVWEEYSHDVKDYHVIKERGYLIQELKFVDHATGELMGYLKVQYVTAESIENSFGSDGLEALRWYEDYTGSRTGFSTYVEDDEGNTIKADVLAISKTPEERLAAKKKVWAKAHAGLDITPEGFDRTQLTWGSLINLTADHAPSDEAQIDKDLKALNAKAAPMMADWRESHKDPSIDYARIKADHRGKGLGEALYVYAGRMMGQRGRVLRASGLQSPEAQKAWNRMASDRQFPVAIKDVIHVTKHSHNRNPRYVLDFTHEQE